jgi:E3 ubiquitin-protein ligase RBBP6
LQKYLLSLLTRVHRHHLVGFVEATEIGKMSVHYKFRSSLEFDTITFDGLHISVADLKKAIIHQKKLGKAVDFDLQITNAQTKEGLFA